MADTLRNGTPPPGSMNQVVEHLDFKELMIERGSSGLRRAAGDIREDALNELIGRRGVEAFKEFKDNSPVAGASLFAYEMLLRNVDSRFKPADDSLEAARYADLMSQMLFQDLDMPWPMLMSEIDSMLWAGWDLREVAFKRRLGPNPPPLADGTPQLPSRFNDGLIGLGRIAPRAQDTPFRWEFDATGGLKGMHQLDSYIGRQAYLPMEKCLLFRTSSYKSNPEGRSILRTAYRPSHQTPNAKAIIQS